MDIKRILPILCILIIGCTSPTPTDTIALIDIERAFNNPCDILLSELADEIEYIPLENLPESVTGNALRLFATDNYIVAISFRHNQLFDRKTGKFIREIGRFGQGPNEYLGTFISMPFDENRLTILSGNQKNGLEYGLEGNVVRKIIHPEGELFSEMIPLDENYFVCYKNNYAGNEPYKLYIFDDNGNIFNKFPNYHSYIPNPSVGAGSTRAVYYTWKNNVFFFENCVDTLFQVTKNELIPYYRFNLGKYNPPYSEKPKLYWPPEKPLSNKYIVFQKINESDRFLFLSFWHDKKDRGIHIFSHYFVVYDKMTGTTKISEVDYTDKSPVINDIDDFAPLYPLLFNINHSGEMVSYLEASYILDWFEANPEKAKKLPNRLQELSKLKFDDNQVVVILKLKQ